MYSGSQVDNLLRVFALRLRGRNAHSLSLILDIVCNRKQMAYVILDGIAQLLNFQGIFQVL
jgi:hypothetical protein